MIRLNGIGHVLLRVSDVEKSRAFYSTILGLKVVEEDPEHGGVFMALEGQGHTVDLFPVQNPESAPRAVPGGVGVHHVAFHVGSEARWPMPTSPCRSTESRSSAPWTT
jgi:catechol 2,3-dioxygenase-like lactoylglutathione lyase family enzyme